MPEEDFDLAGPAESPIDRIKELLEPVKGIYFSIEDRYYNILDRINEKIPVYKIIDPIDEVAPSLLVFAALFFLFFAGTGLVFLLAASGTTVNFQVIDSEGNFIANAEVLVEYDGKLETIASDVFGEFKLVVREMEVRAEVDHESYGHYNESIEVKAGETNFITLEEAVPESKSIEFTIKNRQGSVIAQAFNMEFTCSGGPKPNDQEISAGTNAGKFRIDNIFLSCGSLTSHVKNIAGYKSKKVVHNLETTQGITIFLESREIKGELSVLVKNAITGDPIDGAGLKAYNTRNPTVSVGQGDTGVTGTKKFTLNEGTYYVKAEHSDYESRDSAEAEVDAGELESITIELMPFNGIPKKVMLKFIDKTTNDPIQGAMATLFEDNNTEITTAESSSNGIVEFRNRNEDKEYAIVVFHDEYVTKAVEDLPLINISDSAAKVVKLEKATAFNSGTIDVETVTYGGELVSGAMVTVYSTNHGFFLGKGSTDGSGRAVFDNMPADPYYANATKQLTSGVSNTGSLVNGGLLELQIVLVLGEGDLVVKVVDSDGDKIEGATVQFFEAISGDKLAEEKTGSDGKTEKQSFKINKTPYIVVKKAGYFPTVLPEQEVKLGKTTTIEAILEEDESLTGFDIELIDVLESDGKNANRIDDGEEYRFKFRVIVPDDNFSSVLAIVRTGLEKNTTAEDSIVTITGIRKPFGSISFSGCYGDNDYADCSLTSEPAKQAVLDYGDLHRGVYYFEAEVFINEVEDDLEDSTYIELRHGAKAEQEGTEIKKGLYLWRYAIGPIEAGIFFDATLEDPSGELYTEPVEVTDDPITVFAETDYIMHYSVHNQTEENFSDVELALVNDNGALSLGHETLPIGSFALGAIVNDDVTLTTSASDLTKLTLSLGIDRPDANFTANFEVSSILDLKIEVSPEEMLPGQTNLVSLTVRYVEDGETKSRVKDVTISVLEADTNAVLSSMTSVNDGKTDSQGRYTLEFGAFDPGTGFWIIAEKTGYNTTHKWIGVGTGPALVRGVLECVELDTNKLYAVRKNQASFELTNNNCGTDVDIVLKTCDSAVAINGISCKADTSDIEIDGAKSFTLTNGESKIIDIETNEFLGVHPVFVNAKLSSESIFDEQPIDIVDVFISPGASYPYDYLNCFELKDNTMLEDKYIYNVFHRDASGTFINNCQTGYDDYDLDGIYADNEYPIYGMNEAPDKYPRFNFELESAEDLADSQGMWVIVLDSRGGGRKEIDFNVLNIGIEGEKYVLVTMEDYIGG